MPLPRRSAVAVAWGVRIAVVSLSVQLPGVAGAAPAVWVADSLQKIRPSATVPAAATQTASISAAQNEFESFQIVITGAASQVSMALDGGALTDGNGHSITEVRLYREGIINLRRRSSSDPESDTGPWPDALVPDVDEMDHQRRNAFPFDVRTGTSRAVWVDVFVPPAAPPGDYKGVLTVSLGGQPYAAVGVNLTVWSFALPSTPSARSAYALAWGAIPTGFGIDGADVAAIARLRYKFGVMGLDHRISLSHHDDGDWYGIQHFLDAYGRLMDPAWNLPYAGAPVPRLWDAHLTSVEYVGPPNGGSDAEWMQSWSSMCAAHGWSDRLFQYTADEPSDWNGRWADVGPRATTAHAVAPPVRTLVTTQLDAANAHAVQYGSGTATVTVPASSVIDVLVPAINFMASGERTQTFPGAIPSYDAFLAYDSSRDPALAQASPRNELWLYESCMSHDCGGSSAVGTGWPSYMIDASAVRNRAMQWLLFSRRTTGELYWETGYALYAKRDAWTDQWAFTGNGDGTLFYPGTPAKIGGDPAKATSIPIASIRLKEIRDGMEDFEYLTVLARSDPAKALEVANAVFPDAHRTGIDPARLVAARAYVACMIVNGVGSAGCVQPY